MLARILTILFPLFLAPCAFSEGEAGKVVSSTDTVDKIIFNNGTTFEGQIITGAKTLVDNPNRYEIILKTGQTVSIEDTGQIDAVLMDGQTLTDPLHRGGRGKLLDLIEQYHNKNSAAALEEKRKALSATVEWLLGEVTKVEAGGSQTVALAKGSRVFSGEEIRANPASRIKLSVANRIQLGLEEGTSLFVKEIQNEGSDGMFSFEFSLSSGAAWIDTPNAPQAKRDVQIEGEGLRFRMTDGLFRVEMTAKNELILSHYRGPEVSIERISDGESLTCPASTRFTFSQDIRKGKGPLNPVRERISDSNAWLEFAAWKPLESKVPAQFVLVGKPKMAPRQPLPILGLSTERFIFQDLQPVAISGLGPIAQATRNAIKKFEQDVGRPPTEAEGLKALREAPQGVDQWKGPYISEDVPSVDPWKRPLKYSVIEAGPTRLINLYSLGENGIDEQGLGDDLR
jgi:hypothetical protein